MRRSLLRLRFAKLPSVGLPSLTLGAFRRRGLTIPKAPPFDTLGYRAYAAIEKRPTCVREGDGISPYIHESITSGFSERLEMVDRAKDILFPLKDVPVKCKDTPTGCKTVPGVILRPNLSRDEIGNIRQFITEQFISYGKGIERNDVKRKLENSIRVFGQLYR